MPKAESRRIRDRVEGEAIGMTVESRMDDPRDQFPVGMRVLAVDDDPTCLLVLEALLRSCKYHVTTTSQANTALQLLRQNKDDFDLVISDVHMPDMDGFKLLEHVGLEMDLPVIMLSAYGDTKLVMKGITHGACDYLLKPVRMEELKNIWQHVIRRKKFDSKEQNNGSYQDKPYSGSDNGLESAGTSYIDQKMTKKGKDQDEDEDEDHENEDPGTQKKRRVVWTVELHHKFVSAVNHLGIDKAVPKKILDLMNVEKLTRENKYRLYLKRITSVADKQADIAAALGSADQSYLRMNSLRHLQKLSCGSGQFQNRSFSPTGVIGRFNSPAALAVHGLPSSRNFQLPHAQNLNKSINDPLSFQSTTIQGMPISDQLQHHKSDMNSAQDLIHGTTFFPITSEPPDPTHKGRSRTLFPGTLMDLQNTQFSVDSQHSEFSLSLLDHGRRSDNWSSSNHANSYRPSGCSRQIAQPPDVMPDAFSQGSSFVNPPGNISSNVPFQGWDDRNQDATNYHSNAIGSSMNSLIPGNDAFNRNSDFNFGGSIEQSCLSNIQGSSNQGSLDFEDLISSLMTQDHPDDGGFI
ncbi:two-component response regulator ARR12 [Senna tora]|uniref:Two-component response regulator n=1 Tax=Senna tora TaxID=362788 RepID=A0A834TH44_9FABA|nr:two-component response regulator ARR12 [Senna tora]